MTQAARAYSTTAPIFGPLPPKTKRAIRRLREEAAAEVERLLALLDATEPDADLEPSLGSVTAEDWQDQKKWAAGGRADLELDDADDEPWLGTLGNGLDLEDEFDGREDDVEDEPTLGATEDVNQTTGWMACPVSRAGAHEPEAGDEAVRMPCQESGSAAHAPV